MKMMFGPSGERLMPEEVYAQVGPGWRLLLERLLKDLAATDWDGRVYQVKEKFGTLRFYIGAGSDEVYRIIGRAEIESVSTCEICGQPGTQSSDSGRWIKTLCELHHQERSYKQRESKQTSKGPSSSV